MTDTLATISTDLASFFRLLHLPDTVVEIRAPNCPDRPAGSFRATASAYVDSAEQAATLAKAIEAKHPPGVYLTVNPVAPALVARSENRIDWRAKHTTGDDDILRRVNLLIDVDSVRPAGVSATEEEMQAALELARRIGGELSADAWPAPIIGMSGNGGYLFYRIDLPNDPEAADLCRRVLIGLAERFNTEAAKIDTTTYNASRICKVLGTTARKGSNFGGSDGNPARPWRQSWFEPPAGELAIVSRDLLESVASDSKPAIVGPAPSANGHHASNGKASALDRCRKYLTKMRDAISGQGGHNATHAAACECFKFGLSEEQALGVMQEFNATKTGGEQWSERELHHKLTDALEKVNAAGEFGMRLKEQPKDSAKRPPAGEEAESAISRITNAIEVPIVTKDSEEANKKILQPLPMEIVQNLIRTTTDAWPRRVDQALFVADGHGSVSWLLEPAAMFGWLGSTTGIVKWHSAKGCATKNEVFAEVIRTTKRYEAIEEMPHHPPLAKHYYACPDVAPGDGAALRGLLDRFAPATDIDRDLILAAIVTPLWGGPAGARPAFVFTAAGRGKGKSIAAQMIGRVFTGSIDFSANEDMSAIKTRLLSADALTRRIALLDNVKSLRFSWAELEALITAPTVSGKRLFVGEGRRPNTLTWFITLNGASLSTDMAQRSVIVHIGEPTRSKTWEQETTAYIEANRWKIIADCIAFLKADQSAELESYSRWATWEAAVLSRLPEPNDAQRVILERQGTVDVEREEAAVIHDYFEHQLTQLQFNTEREIVFIPTAIAAEWYGQATGERRNVVATGRVIDQLIGESRLPNIARSAGRTHGRGLLWTGEFADISEPVAYDLFHRWTEVKSHRKQDA